MSAPAGLDMHDIKLIASVHLAVGRCDSWALCSVHTTLESRTLHAEFFSVMWWEF